MHFMSASVRFNSVLIIEPNKWHAETLPGFAKHFIDLGYNVDILCRENVFFEKTFCRFNNRQLRLYQWLPEHFIPIVSAAKLQGYKMILLNTFFAVKEAEKIFNKLKNNVGKAKFFFVEHNVAKYSANQSNVISLNDFSGRVMVNPHFFGNVNITPKNRIANFVCVGNIEAHRRNYNLLFSAVQELINAKMNFKISLVGNAVSKEFVIPPVMAPYIEIKGRLDFPKMYCEMENADFLLALLDPEDIDHEKYITRCSSGAMQLVYGFVKPAVIHQKFAEAYHLNTKNSIVYQENLAVAMRLACNMTEEEYRDKQQCLQSTAERIKTTSLGNLSALLNSTKPKREIIPLCFITDNNFVIPTAVAITSIIKNKSASTGYRIYIVCDKLFRKNRRKFLSYKDSSVEIKIIKTSSGKFHNLHTYDNNASCIATISALLKFEIPNLIHNEDRILYLDGDILVKDDLTMLYNTNIENIYAAVCRDTGIIYNDRLKKINVTNYFNSGVMLLNLKKLRDDKSCDILLQTKKNMTNFNLMDQDVFNIVFNNNIEILDIKYNFLCLNLKRAVAHGKVSIGELNNLFGSKYASLSDVEQSAVILHFSSKDKPWKYTNDYTDEWFDYFNQSCFKKYKIEQSDRQIMLKERQSMKKLDIRDLFGKLRRISLKAIFGRELVNNIANINQLNETIVNLQNTINANSEFHKQAFSRIESNFNQKTNNLEQRLEQKLDNFTQKTDSLNQRTEELNKKINDLNSKTDALNQNTVILNKKADILDGKTDVLSQKTDIFNQKEDIFNQKIDIYSQKVDILTHKTDNITQKVDGLDQKANDLSNKIHERTNAVNESVKKMDEQFNKNSWYRVQKYAHENKYSEILSDWYAEKTNKKLDLNNPRTFNEKIQWLKLYDSTPLKTRLADKYLVRDWIKDKIGEEYLIHLLGVYNSFDEIDFDMLPNQFVLKANHGSAWNAVVKDKTEFDKEKKKSRFDDFMRTNFAYRAGLELHYRDIKPKIIAEKYMVDESGQLKDYRFVCFGGEPKFIWVDFDRYTDHKRNIYDLEWNLLPFSLNYPKGDDSLSPPANLKEMISLAKDLSEGFYHVRVDFYSINSKIYFGEMTFTNAAGIGKFEPAKWDGIWGEMIKLPIDKDQKA